ncbi:hypothetical protein B9Z19DRAFT_1159715 [Tuber borchii]|uniref:Uncharacterized protein n=1 Tax=Tuber borchii TaxID=42251 RepID=A0A2T6ZFE4_TUBBO|nr:hypothetical protein B9Z19DRAFT_1159715 [Tuber borchii]
MYRIGASWCPARNIYLEGCGKHGTNSRNLVPTRLTVPWHPELERIASTLSSSTQAKPPSMLPLINRLFVFRVGRKPFHPSITAARLAHTGSSRYTMLPTNRNITQPLSFGADRHASLIRKGPQEENRRDLCDYTHNFVIDSEEDMVDTTDIKGEIMRFIAAKTGTPYLSNVPMAEAKKVLRKCPGFIYGSKGRAIVPSPVSYGAEARWIYFILLRRFRSTYLSTKASEALGLKQDGESMVTIAGQPSPVFRAPQDSPISNINVLGTDFLDMNNVKKVENYGTDRVQLFFSELDEQDAVFDLR